MENKNEIDYARIEHAIKRVGTELIKSDPIEVDKLKEIIESKKYVAENGKECLDVLSLMYHTNIIDWGMCVYLQCIHNNMERDRINLDEIVYKVN